jgi:hypothetical protein
MNDNQNEVVPTPSPPIHRKYGRKPIGTARRSNYPYYNAMYGGQIKKEILKMLENRKDIVYLYDVFCTPSTGVSHNTLYMRINQSLRFALDHLDDEKRTLTSWYSMVRVERRPGSGVRISFIPEFRAASVSDFAPSTVIAEEVAPQWKLDMDEWLESGNMEPLKIGELALTQEQVKALKLSLKGIIGIVHVIKSDSITLMRT